MKLKTIHISNYRKIYDVQLNMEDSITIIAGANNSGKTSLVELLKSVFGSGKCKFESDDFSAIECQKWSNKVYPMCRSAFTNGKQKEEIVTEICEIITKDEKPEDAIIIPPIEVKIQIDYNEKEDDIRHFADYIMELDSSNTSFYFIYRYGLNRDRFWKSIDAEYEKLSVRFSKLSEDEDKNKDIVRVVKEMLISLYAGSCEEMAYFSDKLYKNRVAMDISSFKNLFNYNNIMAGRTLDDENTDRTRILSKSMVDIASQEESWQDLLCRLPDQIIQPIQQARIQERVREASLDSLRVTMEAVSRTNGGHAGNIVIDMNVTEDAVHALLKSITSAKYQADDHYLRESSQGLGYSNLIYIHLQLERFKRSIDPLLVNIFIIEEPEAHMHPQMQNVFAQYLFEYYNQGIGIQGVLTTHSHEVVRSAKISQLRVLRQEEPFRCRMFDLREFQNSIASCKELLEFYDFFYAVNFPDIIFADKIIMYEGDTERMLIKSALCLKDFEFIRGQYVSFVQVGGAYAYNYKSIIDFLGIKTVLITDLDYDNDSSSDTDVLASTTTNSTINKFSRSELNQSNPTIQKLYDWQNKFAPIVVGSIYLAFQGENDHFSRTLEEAMLAKYYGVSALDKRSANEWKKNRGKDKLIFTIPRKEETCSIHDIVEHTSNRKTDFMYSVILNNLVNAMLPAYIREALLWLAN